MILQQTMKKERRKAMSRKRKKARKQNEIRKMLLMEADAYMRKQQMKDAMRPPLESGEVYRKRASWLPQQGTIPLDTPIEDCPLTIRTKNSLKVCGLWTVEDLTNTTMLQLVNTRNMGKKALDEIKDFLHRFGLSLKPS